MKRLVLVFSILPIMMACTPESVQDVAICVTEVRHFCDMFEPCEPKKDETSSTYQVTKIKDDEIRIQKSIAEKITMQWEAKQVPNRIGEKVYVGKGDFGNMTFRINEPNTLFVLQYSRSSSSDVSSQTETGTCSAVTGSRLAPRNS